MVNQNPFTAEDMRQIKALNDLLRRVEEEANTTYLRAVERWLAGRLTRSGFIEATCCGALLHPNAAIHVVKRQESKVEGQQITLSGVHWIYCNACLDQLREKPDPNPPGGTTL